MDSAGDLLRHQLRQQSRRGGRAPATAGHAPGTPTAITATAPASAPSGEITVTWTPPSSDGGSAITGYMVTANDLTSATQGRPSRSLPRSPRPRSQASPPATPTAPRSSPSTRSAPQRRGPPIRSPRRASCPHHPRAHRRAVPRRAEPGARTVPKQPADHDPPPQPRTPVRPLDPARARPARAHPHPGHLPRGHRCASTSAETPKPPTSSPSLAKDDSSATKPPCDARSSACSPPGSPTRTRRAPPSCSRRDGAREGRSLLGPRSTARWL